MLETFKKRLEGGGWVGGVVWGVVGLWGGGEGCGEGVTGAPLQSCSPILHCGLPGNDRLPTARGASQKIEEPRSFAIGEPVTSLLGAGQGGAKDPSCRT